MDIVFDFDGVLCEYEGWRGHDKIGKPIPEWVDAVKRWSGWGHKIKLHTTRLNPFPFGDDKIDEEVVSLMAKRSIINWLSDAGILDCFTIISEYKPYGDFYIDDRNPGFNEWNPERIEEHYKLRDNFSEKLK